jgi:maltooligosyltrehalose trehalohydrolase
MGATVGNDGTRFTVWAPNAHRVEVVIEDGPHAGTLALQPDANGVHTGFGREVPAGTRYWFRLDGGNPLPDPYSRYQPDGPHGPSEVIDPAAFDWTDGAWQGLTIEGLVVYELHVGTMASPGTFEAVRRQLPELRRLGVTAIEIMPVADTPGERNWGYDGVNLFAPNHNYGRPDDLRRLVDDAHRHGLGVILDVVYNHLGPDGNYLHAFSSDYFTARHQTPWGDGVNFDGPNSRFVRDLVIDNACAWLQEYHIDGLRLDAIDAIADDSTPHILAELSEQARAATPSQIVLIAEQASNEVRTVHPVAEGGLGIDAVWADDFHHVLRVMLTREDSPPEGYFADYRGTTSELKRVIEEGFLYQGETGISSGEARGEPVSDEPASAFVFCIENHDQVGNRAFGERLSHLVSPGRYAAASALLLFLPQTPMLFMGQEFAASAPFQFFTDHNEELGQLVAKGRRQEFRKFSAFADPAQRERIPNPQSEATFTRSQLDLDERSTNRGTYRLYRDLLRLRQSDPVLRRQSRPDTHVTELGPMAVAVKRAHGDDHRVLIANFGTEPLSLSQSQAGELGLDNARALVATGWRRYGGTGDTARWRGRGASRQYLIPAESAIVLATTSAADDRR